MKKLISFVLITTLMMTLVPAMGLSVMAAGEASGTITNVAFSDAVINNFSPDTFTYNIAVPVYYTSEDGVDAPKYKLPKIISYELADDTSDRAVVTDAKTVPGTAKIEVYRENELLNTYTFNLDYAGKNMYSNGGAELGTWELTNVNNAVQTDVKPAQGNYCMNIDFGGYYAPDNFAETLSANTTYLAQSMVRRSAGRTDTVAVAEAAMYVVDPYTIEDFEKKGHGNIYFWNDNGTPRNHEIVYLSDDKWIKHYRTIVPNKDCDFADIYYDPNTGIARFFTADEYFLGELVANVKVKDENNAEEITIDVPTAELTRTLTAEMTNQLGNKAGLGTEAPEFTWELIGPSDDVKFNNGVVTIEANAEAGTYYISAVAQTGIAKGSYKINILDTVSLESLRITGAEDLDFSGANTSYSVAVPLLHVNEEDTYTMPKVEAKALFDDANIEYIYPETIPGDIKVIVTNGGASKTYTISLELVGENMYSNGGAELGTWQLPNVNNAVQTDVNPANGTYCMNIDYGGYYAPDNYAETLSANKTYLAQSMVRRPAGRTDTVDVYEVVMYVVDPYTTIEDFEKKGHGNIYCWNEDGTTREHAIASLSDDKWIKHYRTIVPNKDGNFADIYYDPNTGLTRNFTVDEYFLGELVIADIDISANTKCFKKSEEAQNVQLTATVLNNIGNFAGIKDKTTTAWRLGKNAPADASITDAGLVTIPANYNGTFEIEAVATPTWAGAAQKSFVKAYEIAVGDVEIVHTATDDGVTVTVNYAGDDVCKLINAIYDIKGGEWIFKSAEAVEVNDNNLTKDIPLSSKQGVKTFFWKWDDLTPVTKPYTFKK